MRPVYPDDPWHDLVGRIWDQWTRPHGWRERLVKWLMPNLAEVLDASRDAETAYLVQIIQRRGTKEPT